MRTMLQVLFYTSKLMPGPSVEESGALPYIAQDCLHSGMKGTVEMEAKLLVDGVNVFLHRLAPQA